MTGRGRGRGGRPTPEDILRTLESFTGGRWPAVWMMPSGYTCDFSLGIRLLADCFMDDREGLTPNALYGKMLEELRGRLEEARGNPRLQAAIRRAIERLEGEREGGGGGDGRRGGRAPAAKRARGAAGRKRGGR